MDFYSITIRLLGIFFRHETLEGDLQSVVEIIDNLQNMSPSIESDSRILDP